MQMFRAKYSRGKLRVEYLWLNFEHGTMRCILPDHGDIRGMEVQCFVGQLLGLIALLIFWVPQGCLVPTRSNKLT